MSDFIKKFIQSIKKYNNKVVDYTKRGKIPALPYKAYMNYADTMFIEGSHEQAEEYLKTAICITPSNSNAYANLGILKQQECNFEEAEKYFQEAVLRNPNDAKLLCLMGSCEVMLKKYDDASIMFDRAEKIDPTIPDIYICRANMLMHQGKYAEAYKLLTNAAFDDKVLTNIKFVSVLASLEIELGMYDDALQKYEQVIELFPEEAHLYHNVAYIHYKQKHYKDAIECLNLSIRANATKFESYLLLSEVHLEMNQFQEACATLQFAEIYGHHSPVLYISWANILKRMYKFEEAIEKYQKAIEMDNALGTPDLYSHIADCYAYLDDYENAKIYVDKSLAQDNKNNLTNKVLAQIYINNQDFEPAIEILKKCSEDSKIKADSFKFIARAYHGLDRLDDAKKYYLKYIDYADEKFEPSFEYVGFLADTKNWTEAERKINSLEKSMPEEKEYEVWCLSFIINYNLAKQDSYSYNFRKAKELAQKLKEKYPDRFIFESEYNDLENTRG